jgi:hypothetical protein
MSHQQFGYSLTIMTQVRKYGYYNNVQNTSEKQIVEYDTSLKNTESNYC